MDFPFSIGMSEICQIFISEHKMPINSVENTFLDHLGPEGSIFAIVISIRDTVPKVTADIHGFSIFNRYVTDLPKCAFLSTQNVRWNRQKSLF